MGKVRAHTDSVRLMTALRRRKPGTNLAERIYTFEKHLRTHFDAIIFEHRATFGTDQWHGSSSDAIVGAIQLGLDDLAVLTTGPQKIDEWLHDYDGLREAIVSFHATATLAIEFAYVISIEGARTDSHRVIPRPRQEGRAELIWERTVSIAEEAIDLMDAEEIEIDISPASD